MPEPTPIQPPRPGHPAAGAVPATGAHEVRAYLKRLVSLILLGVVIMATAVVVAWRTWGGQLVDDTTRIPVGQPGATR